MDRPTILAVHRDAELAETLNRANPDARYICRNATCDSEALDILGVHVPRLVILDAGLSLQSRFWILKEIRRLHPDLPVIVVTRPDWDEVKRMALDRGASLYLDKPLNAEVLRRLLLRFLPDPDPQPQPDGVKTHPARPVEFRDVPSQNASDA